MKRKSAGQITIKGIREGLLITLGSEPVQEQLPKLAAEIEARDGFFNGSRVTLAVGANRPDSDTLGQLQKMLDDHGMELWAVLADDDETKAVVRDLGLATRLPGGKSDLNGKPRQNGAEATVGGPAQADPGVTKEEASTESGHTGSNTLLLQETIRSGRSVYHEGHVVVIGDLNPGAEIIAGGNVVVWGKCRGLVHAGAHGDSSAVICALALIPTQLRIADQIAISPNEKQRNPVPETVSIRDGQIIAEGWFARN